MNFEIGPFWAFILRLVIMNKPQDRLFCKAHVKSFISRYNLSAFGDVRNLTPYTPKCPRMTSGLFIKLQKNILTKLSLLKVNWEKNNHVLIFLKIKQMCYFEVSYFRSGIKFQKKLLAILKSIKS